jgi:CMP-N-acetylneuraminic acid synthetase
MSKSPDILAVIPARAGSKGIPHKNVRLLAGKPLLEYSCACALNSQRITRTIVSTDCEQIARLARTLGVEVPFVRPRDLASDRSPMLPVVEHALTWLRTHEHYEPEIVVLLQPTAPLRQAADVDAALERLQSGGADGIVSVRAVETHFHPDWQFTVRNGRLQTYTGTPCSRIVTRRQLLDRTYIRNGAIYAVWTRSFFQHQSLYGEHCMAFEMPPERSVNIDTLSDLKAAEAFLRSEARQRPAA